MDVSEAQMDSFVRFAVGSTARIVRADSGSWEIVFLVVDYNASLPQAFSLDSSKFVAELFDLACA